MPHGIAPLDYAEHVSANMEELTYPSGNVKVSKPRPKQRPSLDPLVYIFETTGEDDEDFKDGGLGTGLTKPSVQIRVRSRQNDPGQGRRLAHRIFDVVRFEPALGYCRAAVVGGQPFDLGPNVDGDPEWSITVRAWREVRPRPWYWGASASGGLDAAGVAALANTDTRDLRFRTFITPAIDGLSLYWAGPVDRNGIGAAGQPVLQSKGPGDSDFSADAFVLSTDALAFSTPLGPDTYQVWEAAGLTAGLWTVEVR